MEGVIRVDLLTRQIACPDVDYDYAEPIEMLSSPPEGSGNCGAYIIRIPCGPVTKFVDGALSHIVNMARALGEQFDDGKLMWPYVIHGHYADAGEVAACLSDAAEMVVTSTRQEIEEQWGLYDGFDVKLERKLRVRKRRGVSCLGRYMPRMVVIPPGMDFSYVKTEDSIEGDGDLESIIDHDKALNKTAVPPIWTEGVFINPALVEPFGLTIIEASAYGLPVVATKNGGPVDILKALNNGLLVDPHDQKAIEEALLKLVADKNLWIECHLQVDDLRQKLRMRSFRCNTVFTHAANRLNVIPLFASRAQALRYLSIRWGTDLNKMFVFVGEKGDTDYEDLLVGIHKTVILKDSVKYGSEKLLRGEESFKKEDMVPTESSNIVISQGYEVHDISAALKTLGID
ncbi:hypothetical protein E3N88_25430 [Mikania micrantha]|uniref:sucrose-phosphate synthase n=1 Tax=Mikania micrantha TaxID=192012 RepID=A0A5N6N5P1_9ASTR|nr:hypothetical protein E3N88_25430 [Mikania micrantha]